MFWRYGFDSTSSLDTLLNRVDLNDAGETYDDQSSVDDGQASVHQATGGPPTVEELLEEQELLNELKVKNPKLVKVLSSKGSIRALLSWSIYGLDDLEAKTADEWAEAEKETDIRETERQQNGHAHGGDPSASEDGHSNASSSAGRVHLPEIIPRLSSTTSVLPRDTEGEHKRQRFSQIATEVLCAADVWEIQSTLAGDVAGFLAPFWEAALGYGVANGMWARPDVRAEGEGVDAWRRRRERYAVVQQAYEARHVAPPSSSSSTATSDEDDKRREILRNNFVRVNNTLLTHHAAAVFTFIQTLPDVLPRILDRIESTAMQDLLLKIISLAEAGVPAVTAWLTAHRLIPQLYRRMSPRVNATTHTVIFDLVKAIVALSSPGAGAAGAFNPNGGNGQDQNAAAEGAAQGQVIASPTDGSAGDKDGPTSEAGGQRDNGLIREMVNKENVEVLIGYMFEGAVPAEEVDGRQQDGNGTSTAVTGSADSTPTYAFDPYETPRLPSHASINSSFCNIINIFIELIRKNNSDFAEPHLFHTMRNRLIRLKQRAVEDRAEQRETERKRQAEEGAGVVGVQTEEEMDEVDRGKMEDVMAEMSGRMGIVHLGALMDALSGNVDKLQAMIEQPRSLSWLRTPGNPTPLTQERFRIMELYAELLHCSNMSILNRQQGQGPDYSSSGCLEGGLEALEKLGSALEGEAENAEDDGDDDEFEGEVQKAKELPVSVTGSATHSRSTSEQGDGLEEADRGHVEDLTATDIEGNAAAGATVPPLAPPPPSQADVARLRDVLVQHPRIGDLAHGTSTVPDSEMAAVGSNVAVASTTTQSVQDENMEDQEVHPESQRNAEVEHPDAGFGDDVLPVGDKLKQLLIRHHVMRSVVNLFFEYPLNNFLHNVVYDIIQQMLNGRITAGFNRELIIDLFNEARLIRRILDAEESTQKEGNRHIRPGYMGHLLLIGEEVEKFQERCPADLYSIIQDSFDRSEWDAYVNQMKQDKIRDSQPLGGVRPQETLSRDDESDSSDDDGAELTGALAGQPLTRATSSGEAFKASFGFGNEAGEGEGSKGDQFSRYFMRETHSGSLAFSDDDSDDSSTESPAHAARIGGNPRRLSEGFDDAFSPPTHMNDMDDDDAWGDFASANAPAKGGEAEDPFGDSFAAPAPAPSSSRNLFNHRTPFTSADFAEQAFRQQYASEESWTGSAEQDSPIEAPEMGDDSFESAASFLAANWSIPGGDVGESLPPTMGSISLAIETPAGRRRSSTGSASSGSTVSPSSSPDRPKGMHPAAMIGRRNSRHRMISPPDSALINATSDDERLGPGVSPDTHVREDGLLEREVNGHKVVAAQDDISLAATHHARRMSRGS